jgi:glyoxylase-like metal-dependent hydrolase (beta-lactamase superfamily II)
MRALESDKGTKINGMGYVIRLADGSFIVYDGGYTKRLPELWNVLTTLNGGEEGIVIRAWLLTHAHGDHYAAFRAFAPLYADNVTLETVMISPVEPYKNVIPSGIALKR